jgi:hypothetical protein
MPRAGSWGFAAAHPDGTGVLVRLGLWPDAAVAWYWAYLFVPEVGLVVVRDHEVPRPRPGAPDLEIRADSLWAELVCETPGEHWGLGLEAFGVVLDDPWDALRGELGTRVPVGFDLEWEHLAPEWRAPGREHQFGRVHGDLLVGRERFAFDAVGAREHHATPVLPEPGGHRASFAFDASLAADVVVDPGGAGLGYVWRIGDPLEPADHVRVESRPAGPDAAARDPGPMRYVVGANLEVEAETAGFAVVPLPSGHAVEALLRVVAGDGTDAGAGFAEWVNARA